MGLAMMCFLDAISSYPLSGMATSQYWRYPRHRERDGRGEVNRAITMLLSASFHFRLLSVVLMNVWLILIHLLSKLIWLAKYNNVAVL